MNERAEQTDPANASAAAPSWRGRVLRSLRNVVVAGLLLIGAALLVLQIDAVSTWTAQQAMDRFNPLPGTQLTVQHADGTWLGSLRLIDATLIRTDTSGGPRRMAHVDTVAVSYRLLPLLLQNTLHVERATVAGPSLTMRQAADSTWDWAHLLPASEDTTASSLAVRLDRVDVRRGGWTAAFYTPSGRDSTARVAGLRAALRDVRTRPSFTATLDTLGLRARVPGDTADLTLGTRARLEAARLELDTLRLVSPRSRMHGGGRLRLPTGATDSLDDVRFRLTATPLSFRDVASVLPPLGLDPSESLMLDVQGQGTGRLVTATAEARFADGGRLRASAQATPYAETRADASPLRYALEARARDVTTSLLGPRDPSTNRLNARLRFDLRGPSIPALSGPLTASLTETTLFGVQTDSTRLDAAFTNGSARVELRGRTFGAPFSVDGFARPLDAVPTFNVSGRVQELNVARLAPDAGIESQIAGAVQISGSATGAAGPNIGLRVDVAPSTVALGRIDDGTARLRLTPDTLHTDIDLSLPDSGAVHLAGQAALDGSEQFRLTRGRLRNLNVAAFLGDSTTSAVSGSLAVRGRGLTPTSMDLDASLRLDQARYAHFAVRSFDGSATLREGRLASTLSLTTNGGSAGVALEGRPFAALPRFSTTRGRFANVNIGPLLADTTKSSRLSGTFQARVRGTAPATMVVDGGAELAPSRLNQGRIERGSLSARLEEGVLTASLEMDGPSGRATLTGRATPFAETPSFALTRGQLNGIDLPAFAGLPGARTALTGRLTLDGRQTRDGLSLDGALQLSDSRINRAVLSNGRLAVSVEGDRATVDGQAAVAGGRLRWQAAAQALTTEPSYDATLSAAALDLDALAGADSSLDASVDSLHGRISGTGFDPRSMTVEGTLHGEELRGSDIRVASLDLRSRFRDGVLQVDTLDVASNLVIARGGGTVAVFDTSATSRFDLTADVTGIAPLQSMLGANALAVSKGTMQAHLYGSAGSLRYDGEADLQNLVYNQLRLADLSLTFNGEGDVSSPVQRLEAVASLGFLSVPSLTVEQTDVTASLDSSRVDLTATTRLDRQHSLRLDARLDPRPGQERLTLRAFDMRFGPDRFRLLQEASIFYGEAYRVSGLLLASADQQIAADGVIDFDGAQSFIVTVEQFRLGTLADLSGLTGLDGRMTGTVDLSGPATAPRLTSRLNLNIRSGGKPVGTLDLGLDYDSLAVGLEATLTHAERGQLTAEGAIPFDLRLAVPASAEAVDVASRPLRLSARATDFSVGWVDPFIDPALMRDVGGILTGQVDIRGSRAQPRFDGRLSLTGGNAYLPDTEVRYRDAQATLTFSGDRAEMTEARIDAPNGGHLEAKGSITFPALTIGAFDLTLSANDFIAIDTRAYRGAVIDGRMTLRGTTRRPVLNGTVELQSADVYYTEALAETEQTDLASVQLSQQDQLTLEQRFGLRLSEADTTSFDAYQAMAMDLSVQIERDTWLRSSGTPELNIQFTGDLDLTKAPDEDAQVFGSIEVVEGQSTIRQFGQQFDLTEGTLTFNGDPTMPFLRATAVYEQRARRAQETEVTITLTLEGRPDDLDPSLSSEPPMDTRNIFSYLATGRPANQLLGEGADGGSLATRVALGQATNFVENLAASELGLDIVRVQIDPSGTSYLTVGRYFTPRFFVSIEQPVTSQVSGGTATSTAFVPDLTLEYQLTSYMLLRIQNRQQSLNTNLLVEYAY